MLLPPLEGLVGLQMIHRLGAYLLLVLLVLCGALTFAELGTMLANKEVSAVDVAQAHLDRIGAVLRDQMVAVDALVPWSRGELVARAKAAGDVSERFTDDGVRLSGHLPDGIAAEVQRAAPDARREAANARRAGG